MPAPGKPTLRATSEQTILVCEDDSALRDVITRGLREAGFTVVAVADGGSAVRASVTADAIVLDIGLPDSDGRDVSQAIRACGVSAPIIFLTARGRLVDKLSGFSSGGDDYLTKPFAFAELVARLTALVKRASREDPIGHDGLILDPAGYQLRRGDRTVSLTPTEFRFLARLLHAGGGLVRRRDVITAAWPPGALVHDNTVDQYVSRLRRKLREVEAEVTIMAARGVGLSLK